MTNLKEGQRIDVYEVVANKDFYDVTLGRHYALARPAATANDLVWLIGDDGREQLLNNELSKDVVEAKKCGYYLKVKSLKGGSNA